MNSDKSVGINRISFDLQSIEVIARASYLLTIRDLKQRLLQQVLAVMLETPPELASDRIKLVEEARPRPGKATLFVRLNKQQQTRVEAIKNKVLEDFGSQWQLRDVVIYLCHGLIEKLS